MKHAFLIALLALTQALLTCPPVAAQEAHDMAWRSWKAAMFERVYTQPRAVADDALALLSRPPADTSFRARLQATIELATAAQLLSREAQHAARDWLEAGVIEARNSGPLSRDLAVELLALHAIDDAMLGRHATADRVIDEAEQLATSLKDPAQAWAVFFAKGLLAMARGEGARATTHFDEALQRTASPLQRAVTLTWKAMALRRFAQPVSGMLRTSLRLLDEARHLTAGTDYPVFRLLELYTRIQGEVTLGDFSLAGAHTLEASELSAALEPQGYQHPETASGTVLAQFRREDVVLAEQLRRQRVFLVWGVGIIGLLICVALTVLVLHVRQRRRLQGLSAQLQTRNLELQDLARSRARLIAAACHDLRQPAHALGLSAELALLARARGDAPENTEEVRRRLQSIRRNSITLTDMLGELMDQTRLAGGSYEPDVGVVPLRDLLDEVQLQFGDLARRKGLKLTVEASGANVISDRHLLRRICFNLVSNAVKYTEHGQVTIHAKVATPDQVQIVIQDTGPGMTSQDLAQVFADYVRLDAGKTQEGLGIGLSIVKRATDLLGHDLDLQSVPGEGTTVTLTVDRAPEEPAQDAVLGIADKPGRSQLVAVLEDDPESRQALTTLLHQWGFDVVAATSAADLDEKLTDMGGKVPELLLTDLHLGSLDGLEQAELIRAWPGYGHLPVLLVTGDLDPAITHRALALDITVGHKPIIPRRLLPLVQSALSTSAASAALR